jgi:hypothetical protein
MKNNTNEKKKKFAFKMLKNNLDKTIKRIKKKLNYKKHKEDEGGFHFTKDSVRHFIDTAKQNISTYSIHIVMIVITLTVIIGSFMIFGNKSEGTEISSLNKGEYSIKMHINFVENFIFSKYDVNLSLGDKTTKLSHGEDEDFEFYLDKGEYTLSFVNVDDSSIRSEEKIEINSDTEIGYKIKCFFDKIEIERLYFDEKRPLNIDEIKIDFDKSEFEFENYKDVVNTLKKMGFTNIIEKPLYDIVLGWTSEGEVKKVTINGLDDYKRGNIYDRDTEIIVSYHLNQVDDPSRVKDPYANATAEGINYEEVENAYKEAGFKNIKLKTIKTSYAPKVNTVSYVSMDFYGTDKPISFDPETKVEIWYYIYEKPVKESVYYSTNDKDSVKNGNTGVYAYKSYDNQYDTYWIIDFDSGYVYNYFEGNGDNICSRLKIDSGNLNDYVKITWHSGNDVWSYRLHFKWKNQPDTLIVQDNNGYENKYSTTSLTQALNLRDKKTIKDY